jgi:hypothetical protein
MRIYSLVGSLALASAFGVSSANADPVTNDMGYQGVSGLFNVPTGDTLEYGEFHFSYTNQVDPQGGRFGPKGDYIDGNNFTAGVSPFPGLEISFSNIGNDLDNGSDLVANIKYSPTFIPDNWFDVAIGAHDIGGETGNQRAWFGAVSKQIGDFRFTVGSGAQTQESTLKRWEGGFGGVEYQPVEWFTALAEHDGLNTNVGFKVRTPKRWLGGTTQLYASVVASTDAENRDSNTYFGVGVRSTLFSSFDAGLDKPKRLERRIADSFDWLFSDEDTEYESIDKGLSSYVHEDDVIVDQLGRLKRALSIQGFESIWVGRKDERLYVRFENSVFNRNDIDAIGVALGLVAAFSPDEVTTVDLNLSKYDVPTLRFETDIALLKAFYDGEAALPILKPLTANRDQVGDMFWVGGSRTPYFVPRVSFEPKVSSFVGTELGVVDYSIALRTNFEVPIWSGAVIKASYDENIDQTEDYEEGRTFYRYANPSRWSSYVAKQTVKLPFDIYASAGIGRFYDTYAQDYDGVIGEGLWQSPNGTHQFSFSGGYYENIYYDSLTREVYIGRYRYYWDELDVNLSVEAGQYWRQDRGVKGEVTFNFGDTQVHFYAQYIQDEYEAIGLAVTVPLTFRRDMRPTLFQLKGADSWRYGLSTTVNTGLGLNPLRPGRGRLLPHSNDLKYTYFNRDRLSVDYIQANAPRLRDAYFNWTRPTS